MSNRYKNPDDDSLLAIIADLKRRVENLESGNRIGNTAIDKGALNVNSGEFTVGGVAYPQTLFLGNIEYGGDPAPGWIFRRADGTHVFVLLGSSPLDQFWALYDNSGNILVSDDGFADQGLALPYLPMYFTENSNTIPVLTTTSGTFTPTQTARFVKQHPRVKVDVLCRASDGSTAGEVRLFDATHGEVVGSVVSIPAGSYQLLTLGPAAVDGAHMEVMEVEIQIRRTAGAGTIGARAYAGYGQQS